MATKNDLLAQLLIWSKFGFSNGRDIYNLIGYTECEGNYYCIYRWHGSKMLFVRHYIPNTQGEKWCGGQVGYEFKNDRLVIHDITHTEDCPTAIVIELIALMELQAYNNNVVNIRGLLEPYDYTECIKKAFDELGYTDTPYRYTINQRDKVLDKAYTLTQGNTQLVRLIQAEGIDYSIEQTQVSESVMEWRLKEGQQVKGLVSLSWHNTVGTIEVHSLDASVVNRQAILLMLMMYAVVQCVDKDVKLIKSFGEKGKPEAIEHLLALEQLGATIDILKNEATIDWAMLVLEQWVVDEGILH